MHNDPTSRVFAVVVIIFLALLVLPFPGCMVDEKKAVTALEKAGYSDVLIVERSNYFVSLRGGGKEDVVRFKCTAKNPAGKEVTDIHVFCGWPWKGTTIRSD